MQAPRPAEVAGKEPGARWGPEDPAGRAEEPGWGEKGPAGKLLEEARADLASSEDLPGGKRRRQGKPTSLGGWGRCKRAEGADGDADERRERACGRRKRRAALAVGWCGTERRP